MLNAVEGKCYGPGGNSLLDHRCVALLCSCKVTHQPKIYITALKPIINMYKGNCNKCSKNFHRT
jgi:hypothetical protein